MALRIIVRNNGPIRIEGAPEELIIEDAQGRTYGLGGRRAVSLCRCGHSEEKPFCDGSHGRKGFESVCEARELPPPAAKA